MYFRHCKLSYMSLTAVRSAYSGMCQCSDLAAIGPCTTLCICRTCEEHGYKYANTYCAHLLGRFSHKMDYGLEDVNFARPENHTPMSAAAPNGDTRFWVLEIHILQDPAIGM